MWGPGVVQWLRHCATSRKVTGSFPSGVTGFFSDIFTSDRNMALGSTQPLVKMSTRNISGGKGGRCVRPTTSPLPCAECHEIWEPKSPGILCYGTPLPSFFTFTSECRFPSGFQRAATIKTLTKPSFRQCCGFVTSRSRGKLISSGSNGRDLYWNGLNWLRSGSIIVSLSAKAAETSFF
jgi:hypothetical protein